MDILVWLRAEADVLEGWELFSSLGVLQKSLPAVTYEPVMNRELLMQSLDDGALNPLLFASERAVRYFFEILGRDFALTYLKRASRVFSVGNRGRLLLQKSWSSDARVQVVDCMASVFQYLPHGTVLNYPCSEQYVLEEVSRAITSGVKLMPMPIYTSRCLMIDNLLEELFTQFEYPGFLVLAPSQALSLRRFVKHSFVTFCMGRRSFETLLAWGMPRVVSANEATLQGLFLAVKTHLGEVRP